MRCSTILPFVAFLLLFVLAAIAWGIRSQPETIARSARLSRTVLAVVAGIFTLLALGRAIVFGQPGSLGISLLILALGFGYLWIGGELGYFLAMHASVRRAIRSRAALEAQPCAARSLRRVLWAHRLVARATAWKSEIPFGEAAMNVLQKPAER